MSVDSDQSDRSADHVLDRRSVLSATLTVSLTATGTMLLGTAATAATAPPGAPATGGGQDFVDVSRPELRAGRNILRLRLDDAPGAPPAAAVPLTLGTSQGRAMSLTVVSATGRVAVGAAQTARSGKVSVPVADGTPATVWVTPIEAGPPLVAADTLTVRTPDGDIPMEVWIEPAGGRWTSAGARGADLDLGLVAMHAAVLGRRGNSDVVMWSMPRMRDAHGNPKRDPGRDGQWQWWKFKLNDVESRVLDVGAGTTSDTPLPAFPSDTPNLPKTPRVDNIFCAGAAHLPNGNLLVVGGHMALDSYRGVNIRNDNNGIIDNSNHVYIYDAGARSWRKLNLTLTPGRWYPTVTALPDGRMLITSGTSKMLEGNENDDSADGYWASVANNYLIFDPKDESLRDGGAELIDLAAANGNPPAGKPEVLATYPSVFVLPKPGADGTVIALAETNRGWLYDYQPGNPAGPLVRGSRLYRMNIAGSRSYPTYGAMVLLPITPHRSTMRILAVGGQGGEQPDHRSLAADQPATDVVEIFEVDAAKPVNDSGHHWRYPTGETAKLGTPRILCDTTLLADGTVLISGGSQAGWGDMNRQPVYDAELFDPETETIRPAARAATDRRYHSTALLQLDGTVLKAGSSGGFGCVSDNPHASEAHRTETDDGGDKQPWMTVHTAAERYWPPYLFAGPRPTILGVNGTGDGTVLKYNKTFSIDVVGDTLDGRARAALIRLGSMTHGNEMDQRYIWLVTPASVAGASKWKISPTTPANPAAAPPGDYQLVVVDGHGVPSPARLIRLTT